MNRQLRKEVKTPSKCKHVQSLIKANYNQKRESIKEITAHNLHLKLSLTSLNPRSQIIVFHNLALSLNIAASWYLNSDLARGSG